MPVGAGSKDEEAAVPPPTSVWEEVGCGSDEVLVMLSEIWLYTAYMGIGTW